MKRARPAVSVLLADVAVIAASALEIEEVLRRHPAIAECAASACRTRSWGERVAAAVEIVAGAARSCNSGRKSTLAPYNVPRALRVVDALPRNAMGKVVKPEVAALFHL